MFRLRRKNAFKINKNKIDGKYLLIIPLRYQENFMFVYFKTSFCHIWRILLEKQKGIDTMIITMFVSLFILIRIIKGV